MENLNIDVKLFSEYVVSYVDKLNKFNNDNNIEKKVTHLKLQKLLYFIYVYALVKWNKKLWTDNFEKWKAGPVLSKIYYEYEKYGNQPITTKNNKNKIKLNMLTNIEKLELESLILEINENFNAAELDTISQEFPCKSDQAEIDDQDLITYYSQKDTFINKLLNKSFLDQNFEFQF